MMSCVCQGNERRAAFRPPGACIAALELPPARKMACSGMRVVWGQGCALDETSGRARGGVGLRRHRHGDQERAERCAGAVPLFLRGGLAYGVLILNLQPEAGSEDFVRSSTGRWH